MTKKAPQPTPAELSILQALWRLESATVRQIHEEINKTRESGYTTTLKFLQIMLEKGMVTREDTQRSHVYRATIAEQDVQRVAAHDLLHRVFGGSASKMLMQAISGRKSTAAELAEIRKLLDEMEGRKK